jgi:hypothetical protein
LTNEPKSTFTVGNASKIPCEQYGSIEVSAYISNDFPPYVDAKTLKDWYTSMAPVIAEVQEREEYRERLRRNLPIPKRLEHFIIPETTPVQNPQPSEKTENANSIGIKVYKPGESIDIPNQPTKTSRKCSCGWDISDMPSYCTQCKRCYAKSKER